MPDIAFLNGRFVPYADAVIPIDDRGFQFGDGVYEVIRTYHGRPFAVEFHLARLDRSAQALNLPQPYPHVRWRELIQDAICRAGYPEAKVYLQVTRGVAPRDHSYQPDLVPTVLMTVRELHALDSAIRTSGVPAITMEDIRWGRCDIKSVNLLPNVLARQRAKDAGVFEAILIRDGLVMEGSVSNVVVVKDRTLVTPPEGPRILSGVTRTVVLRLAREAGLAVREIDSPREDLYRADEVFLTGTTVEILGVVTIDGQRIGDGRPGPITRDLCERLSRFTGEPVPLLWPG